MKSLYGLAMPFKVFISCYVVLIGVGLLLALWVVLESPVIKGKGLEEQYPAEALEEMKAAEFYQNLKLSHTHHLGHVFMLFGIAGLYALTRQKDKAKIQVIVWSTIATIIHSVAFLLYSRPLLIIFGTIYAILMAFMMISILVDCFKPVKD